MIDYTNTLKYKLIIKQQLNNVNTIQTQNNDNKQIKQITIIVIMGNQQCKQCKDSRIENFAYGQHQLLQQDNQIYAIVQKLIDSTQPQLKKSIQSQLQQRKQIKNMHIGTYIPDCIVKLNKYSIRNQSYGFKAIMYFQYIPKTLRDRIYQLNYRNQQFTQRQIFGLIYGVQSALHDLIKNNIKHSCLNLDTIMCKNNIYKITDVSSTTYITSYDLVIKGNREQFLSEKIIGSFYNKSLNPHYQLKDDLFSLGMIVLTVAAKKQPMYFYKWDQIGISGLNIKNIQSSLKQIQKKYSSKLIKKIKHLIYQADNQIKQQQTNLTQNLAHLDEQITRVVNKAKKACSKSSKSNSQNDTTVGTPEKLSNYKMIRLHTSSFQFQ